ncbi:hypothetical protein BJV82DRAFT_667558 [Fennellomyces sp. T-0311]|nr:hypothetical protein BJV82DRAFT_667558 [Fennellomyces sp. T-0311]
MTAPSAQEESSTTAQHKEEFDKSSSDPILSSDEAINMAPTDQPQKGRRHQCFEASDYPFGSLFTVLLFEAIVVSVLEGLRVSQTATQASQCVLTPAGVGVSYTNLIYRGLVIAAPLYQLLLCVDTLKQRCTAQLYALILFGFLFILFAGIQTYQNQILQRWMIDLGCLDAQQETAPQYEYALLAVIPASFLMFVACCVRLYSCFHWTCQTYPNPRFKKAAIALSTLLALIKLDLYFCFALAVQLTPSALLRYDTTPLEALLVGTLGLLFFLIAWYAIQNERPWVLAFITVIVAVSIGYFAFRVTTFAQPRLSGQDPYQMTRYSLLYSLLVLVILVTLTTGVSAACTRNMMQGVKIFVRNTI